MKINSLLSIFTPKDVKFFPLLKEMAAALTEAAKLLEELFSSPATSWKELSQQIKKEEIKGDTVFNNISKALNSTFITPFDREDIHMLADQMDDSIDAINRSAQKVLLYVPEHLLEFTFRQTEVIKNAAEEVECAIDELQNLKKNDQKIRVRCKKIKSLEEMADEIYEQGINHLFKEEKNIIEVIKLKAIIQELEKAANKINSTGKVLKAILVKYA